MKEKNNELVEFRRANMLSQSLRKKKKGSRESKTRTLLSKLVPKELKVLKKAKKKEEENDQ